MRSIRTIGLALGLGWAFFVMGRYLMVDNGFLFHVHEDYSALFQQAYGVAPVAFLAGIYAFGLALGVGYAAGRGFQRWSMLWPVGMLAGACLVWGFCPPARDAVFKVDQLIDTVRATLVVTLAAVVGAGIGLGSRLAKRSPPFWFVGALVLSPFLLVTLIANAEPQLLAIVWLFLLADALGFSTLTFLAKVSGLGQAALERGGILFAAFGLYLLSLLTLGLGLMGLTSFMGLIVFMLVMTVLFFRRIRTCIIRLSALPWSRPVSLSLTGWCALAMLTALFAIYWIAALAPEVGGDAIGGRVAQPAIWLREGSITPLPEIFSSYGIFAAETIYLLVMPLTGFSAAKVVQFGLAVLMILSAYQQVFAHRQNRDIALWIFAFWGSTLVWVQFSWGFVDLFLVFFYYSCILALYMWLDGSRPIWLIASGVLGSAAAAVKLLGAGAPMIAGLVVLCITLYRTRSVRRVLINSLWLTVPAVLALLPWLIRSYVLTGNPIYPFANRIFQSPLAPPDVPMIRYGPGLVFPDILAVPWGVFFDPARFVEKGTYHPFLLAMAPLALVGSIGLKMRQKIWLLTGLLAGLAWLVTEQNARYSLYVGYLLSLAIALGLVNLHDSFSYAGRRAFRVVAFGLLLLGFVVQVLRPANIMSGSSNGPPFPSRVVLGEQTEEEYLYFHVPTYSCGNWMNRHYGDRAKIWQVANLRDHLYFNAPASRQYFSIQPVAQPLGEIFSELRWIDDPRAIHQRLTKMGYTHLMYNAWESWLSKVPEDDRRGVYGMDFGRQYMKLEYADRGIRLYKIRSAFLLGETSFSKRMPDLLSNPGFEELGADDEPLHWSVQGAPEIFRSASNTVVCLHQGDSLTQTVSVNEYRLYELELDIHPVKPGQVAYVQINYMDANGNCRLWRREAMPHTLSPVYYRFLQTAPPGVHQVVIRLGGQAKFDNVHFRQM